MKVLIIEDDIQLSGMIKFFLEKKNMEVVTVEDGEESLSFINLGFDLFIINISIPTINGLDVLKFIRETDIETPIIMITELLEISNLSLAYKYGCSDYIKKPFHFIELEVRMNKLIKKDLEAIIFSDTLVYKKNKKIFLLDGKKIKFRKKEIRLVEILLENINKVVLTEILVDYVWEHEEINCCTLRQLIHGIRSKLPIDIIKTHINIGYEIKSTKS